MVAISSSQIRADRSEGARQSPRGDSEPPAETFGPLGIAERLNWLNSKKRCANTSSQCRISGEVVRCGARRPGSPAASRPASASRQACHGQERDLRRAEAVAQDVEEVEVLQRVRADLGLAALHLLVLAGRHELRGDLGVEHVEQHLVDLVVELLRRRHPPDQVLDQRLRHAGVDVVVRHLVADAVGAPAQRQLGEVAGAQHDPAALVGGAEQVVGAQPGLDVLERDVVHRLARRERVAQVLEHEPGGLGDVELLRT